MQRRRDIEGFACFPFGLIKEYKAVKKPLDDYF
jgi:hypothetical protein